MNSIAFLNRGVKPIGRLPVQVSRKASFGTLPHASFEGVGPQEPGVFLLHLERGHVIDARIGFLSDSARFWLFQVEVPLEEWCSRVEPAGARQAIAKHATHDHLFLDSRHMKLLVIEDEVKLAEYLRKGLQEAGFVVDLAHNGIDGLHLAMESDYDLIVLDGMLPGIDGLGLLAALRQSKRTRVLMLTARIKVEDRVRGLNTGADDYMVKPFAFSELVARVQALLRREQTGVGGEQPTVLSVADLEVDLVGRKVSRQGQKILLTSQEFSLLSLLLRRQGQVLSRTEIASQVWDMNFDSNTNVVDAAVRRLRTKVDVPFDSPLIHTVRGVGYILEPRQE